MSRKVSSIVKDSYEVWRLCAAAELEFARAAVVGGHVNVTVADILRTSGMSRRSFYEHFESIDALVEKMHRASKRQEDFTQFPNVEWLFLFDYSANDAALGDVMRYCSRASVKRRDTPTKESFLDVDGQPGGPLVKWALDVVYPRSTLSLNLNKEDPNG